MPSRSRVALSGLAAAAVTATALTVPLGSATAASSDIVISEVYGGGGNSGATYTHDFIELHNTGTAPVDLTGWSVQYASAAGTSWQRTNLVGTIGPGDRYLVQEAKGTAGTTPLPTPDATGTIGMSGTAGKVALVRSTTPLSGCGADCSAAPVVHDFVGYGGANDFEGSFAAPETSNTVSAQRRGTDTDSNVRDFAVARPTPDAAYVAPPKPTEGVTGLEVHDIQGTEHLSSYDGQKVLDVPGVITAVGAGGFWMQSTNADADPATSEGMFVYSGSGVEPGDRVNVSGTVDEYRPDDLNGPNLTITEITRPYVEVTGVGGSVPAPTLVGPGGLVPPATVIEDDATGSVENSGTFDPDQDGIDFWESLEGMFIGIENAQVTGPPRFGELPVVPADSGVMTFRGGIVIRENDFNPERIFVDDALAATPAADTGDTLTGMTSGVVDYSFGAFKLLATTAPIAAEGSPARETAVPAAEDELAVATYNVENLDPSDPQSKFDGLAEQIIGNLASPDLITLEEVQDNSGADDDGVVAADETLKLLTDAIVRAGGPAYEWQQIDPVNNEEGGQPGGNIRVAFLFRTDRGLEFVERGEPSSTEGTEVFADEQGQAHLTRSPGRIAPESPAWDDSRVPLAGEFTWHGETFFAVANHFASKGGSDPLFGRWQPPAEPSAVQRHAQAREVRAFADALLTTQRDVGLVVAGDINDFEFSETVDILVGSGKSRLTDLARRVPLRDRYTYVFEGNSQVLDHILMSRAFASQVSEYDIVHVNAEYADQISDHDPQVAHLSR